METGFAFELKSVDESGVFEGLASVYNNVDHGGDRVLPGAFTETLRKGTERVLCWCHDVSAPIGLAALEDSTMGLAVKGVLDLDTQAGRDAYSRLRKRIVKGLSIGYRSLKDTVKDGIRHLQSVELYEVSLTPLPMNPEAMVTRVKSQLHNMRDYENWLRQAGGFSRSEAKRLALHGWDGGPPDDDDADADDDNDILLRFFRDQRIAGR